MTEPRAKRATKPVDKYMPEEPAEKGPKKKAIKPKAEKKTEDKTKTKKPLTGYMLFCQHHRDAAKKKVPAGLESKAVMPAIAKILGEMWSKESDSNKDAWKAGKVPK
jgi:hypothetical protein